MNRPLQPAEMETFQRRALFVAGGGAVLCVAGALLTPEPFFWGYLFAFEFWVGIGLGCLALWLTHQLTGGRWGLPVRRVWEAGALTLPWLAGMFIPVLLGMRYLYPWANAAHVAESPLLQHKAIYLNPIGFIVRAVVYFAIWVGLAWILRRWTLHYDQTGDAETFARLRSWSALGLVLYLLTVTFSSVDWVMSLEPEWYSTMYGLIYLGGQIMNAMVLGVIFLYAFRGHPALADLFTPQLYNDLGNLLIGAVMLWAYFDFFQYLVIWFGNLPEEIPWYVRRVQGAWGWVIGVLTLFQFALPFVLLLFRGTKRNLSSLAGVAALIFLFRVLEVYWLVIPAGTVGFHWTSLAALVGIGGVWAFAFFRALWAAPLRPRQDVRPHVQEAA